MPINSDIITVLVIVAIAFVILRWLERKLGHRIGEPEIERYEERIKQLQSDMDSQKERYEQRIRELERRIDFLVSELQRAGIRIRDLEQAHHATLPETKNELAKPLLLICGDDQACQLDRQALNNAKIPFQRLLQATKLVIADELNRRRQDGSLYKWLHVSAHADNSGVMLADGYADPAWWHSMLTGLEVVFLAACKTATVADALAGLVTVVFVHEDIDTKQASQFAYAFWRHMRENNDARSSYRQAIIEVPAVAEFTDIRTA
jgi:hypothetical protein